LVAELATPLATRVIIEVEAVDTVKAVPPKLVEPVHAVAPLPLAALGVI
jgi:hypothetical protein